MLPLQVLVVGDGWVAGAVPVELDFLVAGGGAEAGGRGGRRCGRGLRRGGDEPGTVGRGGVALAVGVDGADFEPVLDAVEEVVYGEGGGLAVAATDAGPGTPAGGGRRGAELVFVVVNVGDGGGIPGERTTAESAGAAATLVGEAGGSGVWA